jgi:hypothetical protein
MLLNLKDVSGDTKYVTIREQYSPEEGRIVSYFFDEYPYELYHDCEDKCQPLFNLVQFRRFCDRNLSGDVLISYEDRSYSYQYYVDPEKTWRGSFYHQRWFFLKLNFELLCDWWTVKNKFDYWSTLPDVNARKPEHDWMKNEHIDCGEYDKNWDPRYKMIKKLSE